MAQTLNVKPWGLRPLESWVHDELRRRASEYGQVPSPTAETRYSGPRTAWAKFFSNGISKMPGAEGKDGFLMERTGGFNDSYGFNADKKIVIGVDARGNKHTVEIDRATSIGFDNVPITKPDMPHRPPPSITSVFCELSGVGQTFRGATRKITVKWKCHSLAQLNYLAPYFLTPAVTCVIEWGWNNCNPESLVDYNNIESLKKMFYDSEEIPKRVKKSNGNYDAGIGYIVDYGFNLTEDGGYECVTSIINISRILEGDQYHNKQVYIKRDDDIYEPALTFPTFIEKYLQNIDSDEEVYKNLREQLGITEALPTNSEDVVTTSTGPFAARIRTRDNIDERTFRISKQEHSDNIENFWIRMDVLEDIINAFHTIKLGSQDSDVILEFNIDDTIISGDPFLKSNTPDFLIPNKYAARFTYKVPIIGPGAEENLTGVPMGQPDEGIYNSLFKDTIDRIKNQYGLSPEGYDDLRGLINPYGNSFPVYDRLERFDTESKLMNVYESGRWGYLKDIFINVNFIKEVARKNYNIEKFLQEVLQRLNEATGNICQLKLQAVEYGNGIYTVYDENLAGNSTQVVNSLPVITLHANNSAYIKSATFDVKVSSQIMTELINRSSTNDTREANNTTAVKTVSTEPLPNRASGGDRMLKKGNLNHVVVDPKKTNQNSSASETVLRDRNINNKNQFYVYYVKDQEDITNTYDFIVCEKNSTFLNNIIYSPKGNRLGGRAAENIIPGIKMTLQFLGISGMYFLSQFLLEHAPQMYNRENAVWQISDVQQSVEDNNWTTTITAEVRPLTIIRGEQAQLRTGL
jgi:hypothetical protein